MNTLRLGIDGIVRRHRWIHSKPLSAQVIRLKDYAISDLQRYAGGRWLAMGNLAWLAGGVWLLWQKAIHWHFPSAS